MDDKIKVLCTRCRNAFRARAGSLVPGYQCQCPNCNRMITFDSSSDDIGVRRALTAARRLKTGFIPEETKSK
jgi:hypothetical protein